jgi:uroporphyrin-III C-methyltransferase/precorrin-2 dehydrogenase/sirohydrochlorin ferrochelatase
MPGQGNEPLDHDAGLSREAASGPRYLMLGINMAGLRCLVVGGGRIGTRKAATLAQAGAEVTVVAPAISDALREFVAAGRVRWMEGQYEAGLLAGHWFVVAATADPLLNLRIASDAEAEHLLSCNVSAVVRSRAIFPAVYADEKVTVAVHSNGRNRREARAVRDAIAAWRKTQAKGGTQSEIAAARPLDRRPRGDVA